MVLKLLTRPPKITHIFFLDESLMMICKVDIYKIKEFNNILKMYQQAFREAH